MRNIKKYILLFVIFTSNFFAQALDLKIVQSGLLGVLGKSTNPTWDIVFSSSTAFELQQLQGTGEIVVDWGDGTSTNTYTLTTLDQTIAHTYANADTHTIKVSNYLNITKIYTNSNAGTWDWDFKLLVNLKSIKLYNIAGDITFNSQYHSNLTYFYVDSLNTSTININFNSSYHSALTTYFVNNNDNGTLDVSYTSHTFANNFQNFYLNCYSGGLTACEINDLYNALANVATWTGEKILTITGVGNAQRTTASDANKATIISKGVTVTDLGNGGTCP